MNESYQNDKNIYEIGVDEAGRGPLFGRVYAAAVCLPKDGSFDISMVKDSKKYTSKKKLMEAYDYVINHALYYSVAYRDEKAIDKINILQATQECMHESINNIINKNKDLNYLLLIDGNYFIPITYIQDDSIEVYNHVCVKGGDNIYASIAAASILAKVERDKYIDELCEDDPELDAKYGIASNKGYGTKKHIEGIKEHGITCYHRLSYKTCR